MPRSFLVCRRRQTTDKDGVQKWRTKPEVDTTSGTTSFVEKSSKVSNMVENDERVTECATSVTNETQAITSFPSEFRLNFAGSLTPPLSEQGILV